jgi:hypothetical protein
VAHLRVATEHVWPKAGHGVVVGGPSPEQAVDEAIGRIKRILSEQALPPSWSLPARHRTRHSPVLL